MMADPSSIDFCFDGNGHVWGKTTTRISVTQWMFAMPGLPWDGVAEEFGNATQATIYSAISTGSCLPDYFCYCYYVCLHNAGTGTSKFSSVSLCINGRGDAQVLGETAGTLGTDYICRNAKRGLSLVLWFHHVIFSVCIICMYCFAKSKVARILNLELCGGVSVCSCTTLQSYHGKY